MANASFKSLAASKQEVRMPLDQAQAGTLATLAQSFLKFLGEEAQEGHHPPNP